MKKVLVSLIIIIMIGMYATFAYADEASPSLALSITNSVSITQGTEEVTLKIKLAEVTGLGEDATVSFSGILEYNTDIFESATISGLNGWTVTYTPTTKRAIADPKVPVANTEIAQITLKVKEGVEPSTASVTFTVEEFTDGENDFDTPALTSTIQITEPPKQEQQEPKIGGDEQGEETEKQGETTLNGQLNGQQTIQAKAPKEDTTGSKNILPKAGIPTALIGIIGILIITGTICYIRYKNIMK